MVSVEDVREKLKEVFDPELGLNIADLGLVYDIRIEGSSVFVKMTFTSPACPVGPMILSDVKQKVSALPGVQKVDIELTFEPMWGPEKASPEIQAMFQQQF